jgi:hypothetical protein
MMFTRMMCSSPARSRENDVHSGVQKMQNDLNLLELPDILILVLMLYILKQIPWMCLLGWPNNTTLN